MTLLERFKALEKEMADTKRNQLLQTGIQLEVSEQQHDHNMLMLGIALETAELIIGGE